MADTKLSMKKLHEDIHDLDRCKADRSDIATVEELAVNANEELAKFRNDTLAIIGDVSNDVMGLKEAMRIDTASKDYVSDTVEKVRSETLDLFESAGQAMTQLDEEVEQTRTGIRAVEESISSMRSETEERELARQKEVQEMRMMMAQLEKRMVRVEVKPKDTPLEEQPEFKKLVKETLRERNIMIVMGAVSLALFVGIALFVFGSSL